MQYKAIGIEISTALDKSMVISSFYKECFTNIANKVHGIILQVKGVDIGSSDNIFVVNRRLEDFQLARRPADPDKITTASMFHSN